MTQTASSWVAAAPDPAPDLSTANPLAADPVRPVMVQFRGVTKAYGNGAFALLDLNFTVHRGDFLFLTGPSGSGKSTLLKLIYGGEGPDRGEVLVNGQNVGQLRGDRLSMLRRRIGMVFQDYKLISRRTVAENVALVLRTQGVPRPEIQQRLGSALKMVGLQDKANCFPDQLSGGEQQRAGIARAIIGAPVLLLADEPTGNLDPDNALQVLKLLKRLNSFGITVMVTTHDLNLIKSCQFPVIRLCNGRLQKVLSL